MVNPPQDALRSRLLSRPMGNHPRSWQMAAVFHQRMAYEVSGMFDWREVALASLLAILDLYVVPATLAQQPRAML